MENSSDSYLSIAGESRAIFRDKASKFIAVARPVSTEDEAKLVLEEIRKAWHDANHHCYAYRLGLDNLQYRMNDDGEPSGSAGKPIYGQILSMGLSDLLVVVIRYFGGTKLGIPGLINAYKTSTREALESAEIVEKTIRVQYTLEFDYVIMNEIMRILKDEGVKIVRQTSAGQCVLDFLVRKSQSEKVAARLHKIRNVSLTAC